MKKIRSYTSIWSVEKILYSINDFKLPFPITFTQMAWFVISVLAYLVRPKLTYAGKPVKLEKEYPVQPITAVRSDIYGISD